MSVAESRSFVGSPTLSQCRSCRQVIIWAETVNGKRIPLDAEPAERPNGVFRLERNDDHPAAPLAVSASGEPVYISHFVTCPNADQHRRRTS